MLITVVLYSCQTAGSKEISREKIEEIGPIDTVNLNAVKQRYEDALIQGSPESNYEEELNIHIDGKRMGDYGIPWPNSAYAIEVSPERNEKYRNYVDIYNMFITCFDMYSHHEIWMRSVAMGDSIDVSQFRNVVMAFDPGKVMDKDRRNLTKQFQQGLVDLYNAIESGNPMTQEQFDEKMNPVLNSMFAQIPNKFDVEEEDSLYALSEEWRNDSTSAGWKMVEDSKDRSAAFLHAVLQARSYKEQCALCMLAINTVPDSIVLAIMQELLSKGKYCEFAYTFWKGWRSRCQLYYFGHSRDSKLADELFNIYRKKSFIACLDQLMKKPTDKLASWNLNMFLTTFNTIRNGSCIYGNDANLEDVEIFGL